MKTVQVARRFVRHEWGGVETCVLESCRQMHALGHESMIKTSAALSHPGEEMIQGIQVERFQHFYPFIGLSTDAQMAMDKKGGNLVSFPLMKSLQEEPDVDLLHTHTLNRTGGMVRHVARQRKIPYVVSIHGGVHDIPDEQKELLAEPTHGTIEWGKVIGWWLGSHHVLRDAAAILCYGQTEYERTCERYPKNRVELIRHGVDVHRFSTGNGAKFRAKYGIPRNAHVLLSVARIDPQKDQLLAVCSMPKILAADPAAHLVLMGPVTDYKYQMALESAITDLGLGDRVHMIPGVETGDPILVDAYHGSDVFILPSMHEVFGIVVLEAWATGLPVVAANVGGIRSLVRDGRDGMLFESGDSNAFVAQCLTMLLDYELGERIRTEALDRVWQQFSWERVTNDLIGIYEEVCCEHVAS